MLKLLNATLLDKNKTTESKLDDILKQMDQLTLKTTTAKVNE